MAVLHNVTPLPRGRHRLTREEVRASQRGRIIDAMAEAVSVSGYAHTSVSDVLMRAGVSSRAFYELFDNKEDCFLAAYDAGVEVLLDGLSQAMAGSSADPLARFERALNVYLTLLADEPAFAQTFLIEVYAAGPRARERRHQVHLRFVSVIAELFGASRGERERFACEALVGTVSSLVTVRVAAGAFDELAGLREPLVALVAEHLAVRSEPFRATA